jgi:hypothetical protein
VPPGARANTPVALIAGGLADTGSVADVADVPGVGDADLMLKCDFGPVTDAMTGTATRT